MKAKMRGSAIVSACKPTPYRCKVFVSLADFLLEYFAAQFHSGNALKRTPL